MRSIIAALALALAAPAAQAQYWATTDYCRVETPEIIETVFPSSSYADLQAAAAQIPNSTGKLWKITSSEGAVSHLWGTYHSNDPFLLRQATQVEHLARAARVAAFELDPVAPSRRKFEHALTAPGYWKEPRVVPTAPNVSQRALENIRSRLAGVGLGRGSTEYLTPGGLAMMVLGDPCNDFAQGIHPIQDDYLHMQGAIGGARIIGLEPPDATLKHLNKSENLDLAHAMIELYSGLLDPSNTNAQRATGFALYQRGENGVAMLWERESLADTYGPHEGPALQDKVDDYLLRQRNLDFMETALPDLGQGGVFMAVGSWHIPGKDGMVELLRDAGFAVERIVLPDELQ
jgi:uncharacterized protein YbaP (TraB family)